MTIPVSKFFYGKAKGSLIVETADGLKATIPLNVRTAGKYYPMPKPGGPYQGNVGQPIAFNAGGSYDADGEIRFYIWDWNANGKPQSRNTIPARHASIPGLLHTQGMSGSMSWITTTWSIAWMFGSRLLRSPYSGLIVCIERGLFHTAPRFFRRGGNRLLPMRLVFFGYKKSVKNTINTIDKQRLITTIIFQNIRSWMARRLPNGDHEQATERLRERETRRGNPIARNMYGRFLCGRRKESP